MIIFPFIYYSIISFTPFRINYHLISTNGSGDSERPLLIHNFWRETGVLDQPGTPRGESINTGQAPPLLAIHFCIIINNGFWKGRKERRFKI